MPLFVVVVEELGCPAHSLTRTSCNAFWMKRNADCEPGLVVERRCSVTTYRFNTLVFTYIVWASTEFCPFFSVLFNLKISVSDLNR